ncbi:MAG: hypothetical protein AAF354_04150 [Pseudomonadota bacterium]
MPIASCTARGWRDGETKPYVRNTMRQEGEALHACLKRGGRFYACSDAQRVARDGWSALTALIAEHGKLSPEEARGFVDNPRKSARYQTAAH